MRFGLIHRVMTGSLAALGILALVTSGKLHPAATSVVLLGLLLGLFLPERYRQQASVQLAGVVGPLVVLSLQVARISFGGDPIPIVVEFAAALQVIRLATRRGAAHDHQIILLALLHLIAGTVLGGGLTYAVALLGFLIFTPGALVLSHLRREVEGNYRQGARDRTGMPVDVPRILRSRRVIGRGFLLFTCSLAVPVFLFSALLFMLFPRVGFAWLSVPPISPARVVGFSNQVSLGGVGTIRTDPTLVMRVHPDELGSDPPLRRNFYLRGAVFDTYQDGDWIRASAPSFPPYIHLNQVILRRPPRSTDRVMEIDLERIDPPVVFVPGDAVALEIRSGKRRPRQSRSLVSAGPRGQLQYSDLEESGLDYRVYLPQKGLIYPEREHPEHLRRYLVLPSNLSPRIEALAEELTKGKETSLDIARALEKELRARYTYDLASPSGGKADPLEHFLFESRRGHCEFYSTAMAVMLRLRGVPSRNVTGFVGGTYNQFGEFYAVRQGDAHSWVEAYLPERGWIRFDPTPPSSAESQMSAGGAVGLLRDILEAASQTWREKVEGYDQERQVGLFRSIRDLFSSPATSASRQAAARRNSGRWILVAIGLGLVATAVVLFRRRRVPGGSVGREKTPSVAKSIELYLRLERALEAHSVPRPASTPPLTHARALASAGHPIGPEVLDLTHLYIGARFLGEPLSEAQIRDFQDRVARLRRAPSVPDQTAA